MAPALWLCDPRGSRDPQIQIWLQPALPTLLASSWLHQLSLVHSGWLSRLVPKVHHGLAPGEPAGGRKASRQGETEAAVSAQTHLACSRRQRHSLTLGSASSPSAARSACSSWSGPLRSLLPVRRPRGKFLSSPPLAQVQAEARRGPLRPPGGASFLPRADLSAVPTRTDTPAPARSQGRFPDRTASHNWHRSPS